MLNHPSQERIPTIGCNGIALLCFACHGLDASGTISERGAMADGDDGSHAFVPVWDGEGTFLNTGMTATGTTP